METSEELIAKGVSAPLSGLITQARVQAGLAEGHAALLQHGWTAEKTQKLRTWADELDTDESRKLEAKGAAERTTVAEQQLVTEGKAFVRRVRNIARVVQRRARDAKVAADASVFLAGNIDRSTEKLKDWLKTVGPELQRLEPFFKPLGFADKPVHERALALHAALSRADVAQSIAYEKLPANTAALYEKKGRTLELIEELNAIARNAFDGNAAVIGQFNKDHILFARRAKAEEKPK